MKNIFRILISLAILSSCSSEEKKDAPYTFPPEWEPQQAVWISINDVWEFDRGAYQIDTRLQLVKALHQHVPVKIVTNKDSLANALLDSLLQMNVDTSRVTTIVNPQETYFLRDPGPLYHWKEKDEKMVSILKKYFPDREIIGFNAKEINLFGGGIHCVTQQEPRVTKGNHGYK